MSTTPNEVKLAHLLLSMTKALEGQSLKWFAVLASTAITGVAMARPDPWRVGIAGGLILLLSPLWLRRGRDRDAAGG